MAQQVTPAKVIRIRLNRLIPLSPWGEEPFSDQPWTFEGDITVDPTVHSDMRTPRPGLYTGMDINVGDFITTQSSKILRITAITYQTDDKIRCHLEDFFRLNSSISADQTGESSIQTGVGIVFTVRNGKPILHPLPLDLGLVSAQDLVDIYGRFFYLYQTEEEGLSDLTDVDIQPPVPDNAIIAYDATLGKWTIRSTGIGLPLVTPRAVLFGDGDQLITSTDVSTIDGSFLKEDASGNPYWSNIIDGGTY